MTTHVLDVPGSRLGPVELRSSWLGMPKVFSSAGERLPSHKRGWVQLGGSPGNEIEAKIGNNFLTGPFLDVDGERFGPGSERPRFWEYLIYCSPMILVVIGGVAGALIGILATTGNARLRQSSLPAPIRLAAAVGVVVVSVGAFVAIAAALQAGIEQ